jgi:hypothetical protein
MSQMFNRYAYGNNNPLCFKDPNGEWVWLVFAAYAAWVYGIKAGCAAEERGGN